MFSNNTLSSMINSMEYFPYHLGWVVLFVVVVLVVVVAVVVVGGGGGGGV
jgi:ABC-type polysaccharide transport system permease subunit